MPRFFKENFKESPFIAGDDARHIIKSLRMKPGEPLTVCDTKGVDYKCVITALGEQRVDLRVEKEEHTASEPSVFITLFQCLPKGDKMDSVVRQSVELGVGKIVPVLSSNCVSRPEQKQILKKIERWQKISNEAAGQSGRGILPKVGGCITLTGAAQEFSKFDKIFFCYELGGTAVADIGETVKNIAVIIGPEGGFTAEEAQMLQSAGAEATTLGPRILRTETAPLAAVTAIMLKTNNMR